MKTHTISFSLAALVKPLQQLWSDMIHAASRYPDVRVWQQGDRCGWHGYDPISGDYVCFGTEDEIRSWIEQRYYVRDRNF